MSLIVYVFIRFDDMRPERRNTPFIGSSCRAHGPDERRGFKAKQVSSFVSSFARLRDASSNPNCFGFWGRSMSILTRGPSETTL